MSITKQLFTERFRPKTIKDIVLSERVLSNFLNGLQQNILLTSSPGRGKTSLSYILCNDSKIPYLFINASRETSVDVIREQIVKWCSEPSLIDDNYSRLKGVIIDECDGASEQFYKALRGTIEQFADQARFILTCNYIEKIPDAILSRFNVIDLEFQTQEEEVELRKKYYKKVVEILNEVDITTDKEGIKKLSDTHFPDMRSLVNAIETLHLSGKKSFTVQDIQKFNVAYTELFDHILYSKDPIENYKFINSNYSKRVDDVLVSLGNDFIEFLREKDSKFVTKIPEVIITVADHQYKTKFTIDKFVNLLSCIYKIQTILNK